MPTPIIRNEISCHQQTVEGVLRELHVFALIYNLVRQVMIEAARHQAVPVNQMSFIDALRWLESADTADKLSRLVVLPDGPDRADAALVF